jgi:hypothetical protein
MFLHKIKYCQGENQNKKFCIEERNELFLSRIPSVPNSPRHNVIKLRKTALKIDTLEGSPIIILNEIFIYLQKQLHQD